MPLVLLADQAQDRAADKKAIDKTITALNDAARRPTLFTRDADIGVDFDRLIDLHRPPQQPPDPLMVGRDETWTILTTPRVVSGPIRFTSPDTATVEGASTIEGAMSLRRRVPLQFVMKKVAGQWRIAAVHDGSHPRLTAKDLDGNWKTTAPPDFSFTLRVTGGAVEGEVRAPDWPKAIAIENGHIEAQRFSFTITRRDARATRLVFQGSLQGSEMHLRIRTDNITPTGIDRPGPLQSVTARRVRE